MWWIVGIAFVVMLLLFGSALKDIVSIQTKKTQELNVQKEQSEHIKKPKRESIWPGRDIRLELGDRHIIDWLKDHGPDPELWHFIALYTVCDGRNVALYQWLANQKQLDVATASHLFHVLEGWIIYGEETMTDPWEKTRLPIIKTLFNNLKNGVYTGPKYTLLKLEEVSLTEKEYEIEYTMYRHNHKNEPVKAPSAIFNYANRELIDLTYHYSDFHYNPYGAQTDNVLKLVGSQRKLLDIY